MAAARLVVPLVLLLSLAAPICSSAGGAGAPPAVGDVSLTTVFAKGDCDTQNPPECYPYFRIPAIKRLKSGGLIAFAEARGGHSGSGGDHGDVHIVARASKFANNTSCLNDLLLSSVAQK